MLLVVDDERRWAESVVEELELSGYEVSFQQHVDDALPFIRENLTQIELLIMGIMMPPGMAFALANTDLGLRTGIRFYEKVRQFAPKIPVLIFTNVSDQNVEDFFSSEPCCWFAQKKDYLPFEVVKKVTEILQQHANREVELDVEHIAQSNEAILLAQELNGLLTETKLHIVPDKVQDFEKKVTETQTKNLRILANTLDHYIEEDEKQDYIHSLVASSSDIIHPLLYFERFISPDKKLEYRTEATSLLYNCVREVSSFAVTFSADRPIEIRRDWRDLIDKAEYSWRRNELVTSSSPHDLRANLMWMAERGQELDLSLLQSIKSTHALRSPDISMLLARAEEKIAERIRKVSDGSGQESLEDKKLDTTIVESSDVSSSSEIHEPLDSQAVALPQSKASFSQNVLPERYVNSWFDGHSDPEVPLSFGQQYDLNIQISPLPRPNSFTSEDPTFPEPEFPSLAPLDIVVAIVSSDFVVMEKAAKRMLLPQIGDSPIVKFTVRPIKNNKNINISVLFYHNNSLIHEASISARVQMVPVHKDESGIGYFQAENRFQASLRGKRDLNLQLVEWQGGYRLILFYDLGDDNYDLLWCKIQMNRQRLVDLLEHIQTELQNIIQTRGLLADGRSGQIFFDGEPPALPLKEERLPQIYRVPDAIMQQSLVKLAEVGGLLYTNLFSPAGGTKLERQQAEHVGAVLRSLSKSHPLSIQVLSDNFVIPWNLLYDDEYSSNYADPTGFWGFKHIIEEMPNISYRGGGDSVAVSEGQIFGVGININGSIEPRSQDISRALTKPQEICVEQLSREAKAFVRTSEDEVLEVLKGRAGGCQPLEYFYCHAGVGRTASANLDQSYLGLTSTTGGLTLQEIKRELPNAELSPSPLFILNACNSSRMDGRFYDGFVPRFLDMGALAVVGTDCEVPSLFGAHFGMSLLDEFFKGEAVGAILTSLRRRFLDEYNNPVGLVYRLFGNSDVHLSRALARELPIKEGTDGI